LIYLDFAGQKAENYYEFAIFILHRVDDYLFSYCKIFSMEISLNNKNVLLTGASRGIGASIARALAKSGARIALHFNQNEEKASRIASQAGNGSFILKADLKNPGEVIHLFDSALHEMGNIDVLINNAGISIESPIDRNDRDWLKDLRDTLEVNLVASSLMCKKAVNHFKETGGGIIINISSRAAFRGETAEYIAYAASKGGMISLTRSIAKEFGKYGITAFNIAPGFVKTDMAQQFFDEYGEEAVLSNLALNKLTQPDDLAPLIVLLASGLAEHATGTTIDINAGSYMH
jgi:NAD(P)-dependent dehydrogenase (short-subunit alcohol dehydrogenase family)